MRVRKQGKLVAQMGRHDKPLHRKERPHVVEAPKFFDNYSQLHAVKLC